MGYWVGAFIFSEQLRHAKIYTSLRYANETAERVNRCNPNEYGAKILEVKICLADEEACYGKQSKGEWEEFGIANPKCSLCRSYNIEKTRFCPNCGAKMKGGVEQ